MKPFEQMALAWQGLVRSLAHLARPEIWLPGLALGALQMLAVLALWNFAHPAVSWWMAALLRGWIGEQGLHYPNVLHALPALYARFEVVIDAVVGSVLCGAATLLFATRFRRAQLHPGAALHAAGGRAVALILCQLPIYLLTFGADALLRAILRPQPSGGLRALLFVNGLLGATCLIRALFLYVPALVMLEGQSVAHAVMELPRTWTRGLAGGLTLLILLVLAGAPGRMLAGQAPDLETRFGPEVMVWVVAAQIAIGVVTWLLTWGGATLLYLGSVMEFDEWGDA